MIRDQMILHIIHHQGEQMPQKERDRLNLGPANYLLLLIAALLLIAGYFIMSLNETTISPITLLIAYVGIIPLALLKRSSPKE